MLYVFLVDTGTVLTFDMNLALETVANLKEVIFRACKVTPDKQVLLISGGQTLEPTHRVCSYSAGTDTNPIFLFCKNSIESSQPLSPSINYGSAQNLKDKVEACLADKETTYNTVVARAQLASQLFETAREITRGCEQLVQDQHLQQQGWATVVANLEDIVTAFKGRAENFEQAYKQYLLTRAENMEVLAHFSEDLATLSSIPVLPTLLNPSDTNREETEVSLLDWIHTNDDENTNLIAVADHCTKALDQMDDQLLATLEKYIDSALHKAEMPDMKAIRGLSDRLSGLEQLLIEARKKVQEQGELAQALFQNQQRARNLNDASILPDLCASHRQQLKLMLRHDEKLRDIRNRCSRAKEELSLNLHKRLQWVTYVQRQLAEVDSHLVLQHENLRRLRRHFDLLRQLHQAPGVYLQSLIESVRRQLFTAKFMQWANSLSGNSTTLHQDETRKRKAFQQSFDGHFLMLLFPGLVDQFPPAFATSPPPVFDADLPAVEIDDLRRLKNALPSLWSSLDLPDNLQRALMEPTILEFLHKSGQKITNSSPTVDIPTVGAEAAVLPSLSAALLSPPIRSLRSLTTVAGSANGHRKTRSPPTEFHSPPVDFPGLDVEAPSVAPAVASTDVESVERCHQLEKQVKDQRCQLLTIETQLQCILQVARTALPAFRSELNDIRRKLAEHRAVFDHQKALIPATVGQQATRLMEQEQLVWKETLNQQELQLRDYRDQRDRLAEQVTSLERRIDEWQLKQCHWELEKARMETDAKAILIDREKELEQERTLQVQEADCLRQQQVEALTEEIQRLKTDWQKALDEWRSAAEQDCPEAIRTWRRELMLGHEVELEQLKLDKEAELEQVRSQHCLKYEELEAASSDRLRQLQDQHRLEMEALRARFRIVAQASSSPAAMASVQAALEDRTPSESSLDKFEMKPTPPTSPYNTTRFLTESLYIDEASTSEDAVTASDSAVSIGWWRKEHDELNQLIEEFRKHCRVAKVKPTKWEEALINALRHSGRTTCAVGSQLDHLLQKKPFGVPTVAPAPAPASPRSGSVNMAASVAVLHQSDEKSQVSKPSKKKPVSKLVRSLIRTGANIHNCEMGDTVVVQWDDRYSTHMLYNKGPYLHFLHADSIMSLGIKDKASNTEPFLGRVVQREFCLVRKEENRYNLPKGTNFYRVKVERLNLVTPTTASTST